MLISLVFDESVTNRRTDRPTDGRTDRPGYRDARTHLKRYRLFFRYTDLFAVTYGGYNPSKLKKGLLCLFSIKNPTYPDYAYPLDKSAMCVDINSVEANLIAVGFQVGG